MDPRTNFVPFTVTQGGVADKATRIEFRKGTTEVTIYGDVGVTSLSPVGTDGEDIAVDAFQLAVGEVYKIQLMRRKYGSPPVLYVANDTATTGLTRFDPSPNGHRGR